MDPDGNRLQNSCSPRHWGTRPCIECPPVSGTTTTIYMPRGGLLLSSNRVAHMPYIVSVQYIYMCIWGQSFSYTRHLPRQNIRLLTEYTCILTLEQSSGLSLTFMSALAFCKAALYLSVSSRALFSLTSTVLC